MQRFTDERTAELQRQQGENFGFKLRRAAGDKRDAHTRTKQFLLEDGVQFRAVEDLPTLHRLIDVVEDGHAYNASLREEDRLIEVRKF